jgi:putative hydrolase of the HAD superfamily
MPYDAVIFDLFGTLTDEPDGYEHARAFERIARSLGVPTLLLREAWQQCIYGRVTGIYGSVEDDFRHVCATIEDADPSPQQIERAVAHRLESFRTQLEPREGAIEVLTELKQQGIRLGVISDSGSELSLLWPETAFASLIDAPVFSVEVGVVKPDPQIYRTACERLGVQPEQCLYVGDGSSKELTGALKVGMDAVLICVPYERDSVMERDEARLWSGQTITHLYELLTMTDVAVPLDPR